MINFEPQLALLPRTNLSSILNEWKEDNIFYSELNIVSGTDP